MKVDVAWAILPLAAYGSFVADTATSGSYVDLLLLLLVTALGSTLVAWILFAGALLHLAGAEATRDQP